MGIDSSSAKRIYLDVFRAKSQIMLLFLRPKPSISAFRTQRECVRTWFHVVERPHHPLRSISRAPRETVRDIQASFKFQAGMGANMVVAVFTTFIISYWASKFIVGDNKAHVSDWTERQEAGGVQVG